MKTKAEYQAYLLSGHWRALRLRVLARDGRQCTQCASRRQLQAHHLFYRERWEEAEIGDLVTLCRSCHERAHGLAPVVSVAALRLETFADLCRARSEKRISREEFRRRRQAFRHRGEGLPKKRRKRAKPKAGPIKPFPVLYYQTPRRRWNEHRGNSSN